MKETEAIKEVKNLAIIDEGIQSKDYYEQLFRMAREASGAETITVVISGTFLRNGYPALVDKYDRADQLIEAGATHVAEMPAFCMMLGENQYAFAVMNMLHKLPETEAVLMPYRTDREEKFREVQKFLFSESFAYLGALRKRKLNGEDPEVIYPRVVESFVSGAEEELADPINRFSIELGNTMIKSYSQVKQIWLNLAGTELREEAAAENHAYDFSILEQLREIIGSRNERDARSYLADILFGSDPLVDRIFSVYKDYSTCTKEDYDGRFFEQLAYAGKGEKNVRRYFQGCLAGYRRIDNSISILYGFVPYIRLLKAVSGTEEGFVSKADAEVLIDYRERKDFSALKDESKCIVLKCEERLGRRQRGLL